MRKDFTIIKNKIKAYRGEMMENGIFVIDASDGANGFTIVLALFGGEFVTWEQNSDGWLHTGHYFVDIVDAAKDYGKRLNP